ncbi:hypothetical protein PIB30_112055, partial [Stylosanthes scabra]|nr:hypothetical protein [Stylosanthes scabra]
NSSDSHETNVSSESLESGTISLALPLLASSLCLCMARLAIVTGIPCISISLNCLAVF